MALLVQSLVELASEQPRAYAEMCRVLAPRRLLLHVDGERAALRCSPNVVETDGVDGDAAVEAHANRRVILDLLDARTSLLEALLTERLILRGGLDDLIAFHDGLAAYLRGAVRCRNFPSLLDRYRQGALVIG
jgi:hypothetical protein